MNQEQIQLSLPTAKPLVLYEFPLNETVRNYLRVEHLLNQLNYISETESGHKYTLFFNCLFSLMEVVERIDLRSDLLKDLEAQEKKLVVWSKHPGIDNNALQQTLRSVIRVAAEISSQGKIGSSLKDNVFLNGLKQRFSIPGASCCFDLPGLHCWSHQDPSKVDADIQSWMAEFEHINLGINLVLTLMREQGQFETINADKGFAQYSTENVQLVRIRCEKDQDYYPTVSGNKYRFAIRFLDLSSEDGKSAVHEHIQFDLSMCG